MSWGRRRSAPRPLREIAGFSASDWAVLAGAAVLLPATAAALKRVSLARLLRVARALARERRRADPGADPARVLRLVHALAARLAPPPTCLATALVAFVLLRRRALPARLVIGVTKARGELEGHAWVELGDRAPAAARTYTPLLVLDDHGPSTCAIPGGLAT